VLHPRQVLSLARLGSIAQALGVELHDLLRLGAKVDPRDKALERLRWTMSRRTVSEIDLVVSIAASTCSTTWIDIKGRVAL
jgi:hypothetical protein